MPWSVVIVTIFILFGLICYKYQDPHQNFQTVHRIRPRAYMVLAEAWAARFWPIALILCNIQCIVPRWLQFAFYLHSLQAFCSEEYQLYRNCKPRPVHFPECTHVLPLKGVSWLPREPSSQTVLRPFCTLLKLHPVPLLHACYDSPKTFPWWGRESISLWEPDMAASLCSQTKSCTNVIVAQNMTCRKFRLRVVRTRVASMKMDVM